MRFFNYFLILTVIKGRHILVPQSLTSEVNSLNLLSQCYSKKVFIGGIPAGTSQGLLVLLLILFILLFADLLHANFSKFGRNQIDWPKKTPFSDSPPDGIIRVYSRFIE